ncbi:MAG: 16S rRNA (adenine(1518)-N(6)/adenine(1519)-N(6))-dimethyltransferase RsmA [Candidatus Omnitrophota bacterium]
MKLKRSFSQVFLRDKKYIEKICNTLDIDGQNVLEIGPGEGVISGHIGEKAKQLCCIEYDRRFCNLLKEKFYKKNNIKIVYSNILKFSISKLGNNLIVFGNVPYRISSSIVEYLIQNKNYINKAYLTFQKEFAQKLIARAGEKKYGFLSCYVQYYTKVKKVFNIPAKAFWPEPKVDSSFIEIEFYKQPLYQVKNEEFLFKIIRKAFSNKRKKISNCLELPEDTEINSNLRPQDLSLEDYIKIANKSEIRISKFEMVRQAHHPEPFGNTQGKLRRRTNPKYEILNGG